MWRNTSGGLRWRFAEDVRTKVVPCHLIIGDSLDALDLLAITGRLARSIRPMTNRLRRNSAGFGDGLGTATITMAIGF